MKRADGRKADQLRPVKITRDYLKHPEGSVLIELGDTRVICTASISEGVPMFKKGSGEGWVTAEYGMLPRATHDRTNRETGKIRGRTHEIQRLIGRSLRAVTDVKKLGERTINIDCDVIQADGGTRTASITGGFVALQLAIYHLKSRGLLTGNVLKGAVAAVSVGIVGGVPILDLNYSEDSSAEVDMNIVMTGDGKFVEVQGTAEGEPFSDEKMRELVELGKRGIIEIIETQKAVLT